MTLTVTMRIIDPGCFVLPNAGRPAPGNEPRAATINTS